MPRRWLERKSSGLASQPWVARQMQLCVSLPARPLSSLFRHGFSSPPRVSLSAGMERERAGPSLQIREPESPTPANPETGHGPLRHHSVNRRPANPQQFGGLGHGQQAMSIILILTHSHLILTHSHRSFAKVYLSDATTRKPITSRCFFDPGSVLSSGVLS